MNRELLFFVEGTPRPKQSFRYSKKGHYIPARVRAWQDAVAWAAQQEMAGDEPMEGELSVSLTFYRPNKVRCDLDNLSKAVLDAMNGIVYEDDKQVVDLKLVKLYSKEYPGCRVRVIER